MNERNPLAAPPAAYATFKHKRGRMECELVLPGNERVRGSLRRNGLKWEWTADESLQAFYRRGPWRDNQSFRFIGGTITGVQDKVRRAATVVALHEAGAYSGNANLEIVR